MLAKYTIIITCYYTPHQGIGYIASLPPHVVVMGYQFEDVTPFKGKTCLRTRAGAVTTWIVFEVCFYVPVFSVRSKASLSYVQASSHSRLGAYVFLFTSVRFVLWWRFIADFTPNPLEVDKTAH